MEQNREIEKVPEIVVDETSFRGYTLDEIRYQRALAALRKEYAKEKIFNDLASVRKRVSFGSKEGIAGKAGTLAQKMFSGLNYLDYAMVGYTAFSAIRKFFKLFRKKKK